MCDKQRVHDHKNKFMQTQTSPRRSRKNISPFLAVHGEASSSVN